MTRVSWSIEKVGRPEAVKKVLAIYFHNLREQVAHIPDELKSLELVEQLVNLQLDFASANGIGAVKVNLAGSSSKKSQAWPGNTQVRVELQTLHEFVE